MDQAEQLRTIIKRQNPQSNVARVITVTSGKGGVGKSSLTVNLAIQLRKLGKKVIILDADFGLANIEIMLGIKPTYSLADLLFKNKDLKDIVTSGPGDIGFISGGSGILELCELSRDQLSFASSSLGELDELVDIILVDTGAGISDKVIEFVKSSTEVLLVVTSEPTSITDSYALLKTLDRKMDFNRDVRSIKVIANRVDNYKEGKELFEKLSIVIKKFLGIQVEYLGAVPNDSNMMRSVIQQKPVCLNYPASASSIALGELALMIRDKEPMEQKKVGFVQMFTNIVNTKNKK